MNLLRKGNSHIFKVLSIAFILAISYPTFGEDTSTTIGDLNARIDDLEKQIGSSGGKTDDANPGSQVTIEDLDRIKEDLRALRSGSDDINRVRDELRLLHEDIKQLKGENAQLRAQKSSKKEATPSETESDKPKGKKRKWEEVPPPSQTPDLEGDEEIDSVLKSLEKSAPVLDQDDTDDKPTKKKSAEVDRVREAATKHAEETAPQLPAGKAEALYNKALESHNKGDYIEAESTFSDFIRTYPKNDLVSQAMYWKAESCLKQRKYKEAKILFVNAYKKNSEGAKAGDCLLRLGEILGIQERKDDACTAWRKLKKDFPHMTSEMKTELKALSNTYGCELNLDRPSKAVPKGG